MIVPNFHFNSDGDAVFEINHLSEDRREMKKEILDRKNYKNWITVDPISMKVIKFECECVDFTLNRASASPCKHLKESFKMLEQYGIHENIL